MRKLIATGAVIYAFGGLIAGQGFRSPSPSGVASTQVGGRYVAGGEAPQYQNGKWLEITYGRPIKRGRELWGTGADYGKTLNDGAPVWRAGANVSTRLKTEVPVVINGKTVAAGEYSLFIDLKPNHWTLIVSTWAASPTFPGTKDALFGSFEYTADKDVVRSPMKLDVLPFSVDQLTWSFVDMTGNGGRMAMMWDKVMASAGFTVGK
jgi:hypothetical protein